MVVILVLNRDHEIETRRSSRRRVLPKQGAGEERTMKHETKGYMFAIESGIGVYVPFTGKVSVVEGADPKNEKTADKASTLLGLKVERADTSTEKWGRTVLRIDGAATTVTME